MASRHIVTVIKDSKIAVVRTIEEHGNKPVNSSLFSGSKGQIIQLPA